MANWTRGTSRQSRYWPDEDASDNLQIESSKDIDRILYSTAFRRLGGVTQVVVSSELGLFHNRLTHTLKTAQVGSRIANHLVRKYTLSDKLTKEQRDEWIDSIRHNGGLEPRVVRAACMAHDLGHPPFGHIAEDELQIVTSSSPNSVKRKVTKTGSELRRHPGVPDGYGLTDSFEGNAQSLRIVTKLAFREFVEDQPETCPALNLTKATLAALMKYPWAHGTRPDEVPSADDYKKWGYYECERKIAQWVFDNRDYPLGREAPTPRRDGRGRPIKRVERRTVEAQIMDWADDISYAVHDVEDFFRAGIIPLDHLAVSEVEWEAFFTYAWSKDKGVGEKFGVDRKDEIKALIEPIRQDLFPRTVYEGSRENRERLHRFASSLIKQATDGTSLLMNGVIEIEEEQFATIEILKQLTWYYVIDRPSLESVQRGQRYVIRSLFRDLIGWVEETWGGPRSASALQRERKQERRQLPARLLDYLDIAFSRDEATGGKGYGEPARISRAVVDYIVSLTESQAVELCSRLTGRSERSMLDGWVYG